MKLPQHGRMPIVVLVNGEEWASRSLESILTPEGYRVAVAHTGRQALELSASARPDIVLTGDHLPDMSGTELCTQLRLLPEMRPSTPILLLASHALSRSERLEAYRRGAWGVLQPPFDRQELLAQLGPYVRAKRDTDEALEEQDPATGCYNSRGLVRRLVELRADARRSRRPMSCVVVGPVSSPSATEKMRDPQFANRMAALLRSVTRESDAVARIGQEDFVILAPGTDAQGATRLINRVEDADGVNALPLPVRACLFASSAENPQGPIPEDFIRKATLALRAVQVQNSSDSQVPLRG